MVLVFCAIIFCTQLPALTRSREAGHRAVCANNLRRLGSAIINFAAENRDQFPGRLSENPWTRLLLPYYTQTNVLYCPSDSLMANDYGADATNSFGPRSYFLNGFSDYLFFNQLPQKAPIPVSAVKHPQDTILFGEKRTDSGHWWMDYLDGDDLSDWERARHFNEMTYPGQTGGSNHAFADGSVRFLKFGEGLNPIDFWFIKEELRYGYTPF